MAVLRARAPGARLSIVRTEWRSAGRTTASGTTSSTRTVRGSIRGNTMMANNHGSEKLSSPALVARKPLEISTTRLESDDDSSVEQKYQVSEPSDTEHSETTSWKHPDLHSANSSSSDISKNMSKNNDLFNDIDNFIIKPSQLRKCSTISEESLNEIRDRIKSLVTNESQSNSSDTSKSRYRDEELKVSSPVSRVKSFISKMESNSGNPNKVDSIIGSKSSIASLQDSFNNDGFENDYSDRDSDKIRSVRTKPSDFSSESDFSLSEKTTEHPYRLDLNSTLGKTETFQDWLSKNSKQQSSLFQLPKNNESAAKWDNNPGIKDTREGLGNSLKSTGRISISIPVTQESGSGTARKRVIQHSVCEGTTVSIESSKPHSIITNARAIFPQEARLAIGDHKVKEPWLDSNALMSRSISKTETKQLYDEEFENHEKKNKRVEFCKTEVHFAMESGQVKIVESDDKPPPTNNFRRRRKGSTFVPLAPANRRIPPVTLFGTTNDSESYSYDDIDENLFNPGSETQYATENSRQLYRDEEYHTVTPAYEHDVVPRGILKNKTIKPRPYHLGAEYELGSPKRDDTVWGVKLRPITENNQSPQSGIALLNKSLAQSDRFSDQNDYNDNTVKRVNMSSERIIKVRNERLQNSGLSVYEHLEKLKQSEKFKSDTESEKSDTTKNTMLEDTLLGYNDNSQVYVPVSKSTETKTVAQLAPMSPTKSRKLRENELTYFGIQPSPKPKRKEIKENYSESIIDNKPDIIKHTFVNRKIAPISKFEKTNASKEPAERRNKKSFSDQPIYQNLSVERKYEPVAAPRSHNIKPDVSIEDLNRAAGEISKIVDQYSDEGSPWVDDNAVYSEPLMEKIDKEASTHHTQTTRTTERKSMGGKTRATPDRNKCVENRSAAHRSSEKKLPVIKSHRTKHTSSRESSIIPNEMIVVPPARKKRTQTIESKPTSYSDSRGNHRVTRIDTATKKRLDCIIPVRLESDFEDPHIRHVTKHHTTRREDSSKPTKEKVPEQRRPEEQSRISRASEVGESRNRELRGKQLRTPTPSSRLPNNSAENRTSSRQRDGRDHHTKHHHESQEPSSKRTHESRMIRHPLKDGIISPSSSKRDTSSRDRSGKKEPERVRERKEEDGQRDRERKKEISRQSPGKTVEKKKRLKVTLEIKNPLGPLIKQKSGGK